MREKREESERDVRKKKIVERVIEREERKEEEDEISFDHSHLFVL